MVFEIYKRGQGKYTRMVTLVAGVLIGALVAWYVGEQLADTVEYIRYGVPAAILVGAVLVMFWIVNRAGSADFMIATEGEMKKVSWSSKREIIGGTKVVITTTLILALLLWAVDLGFGFFFRWIRVIELTGGAG